MNDLFKDPWAFAATLAAAAVLVFAITFAIARAARAVARHARHRRSDGDQGRTTERILLFAIITIGAALAPLFFTVMFFTVTHLLGQAPSFHGTAWSVPAATEGSFLALYLLDLYLQMRRKPQGWLRWAPYPFFATALCLNVWSSWGDAPAMLGHAAVTTAFFLPLIAGESAVRSLSVPDEDMDLAEEITAARRYAKDLVRDQVGWAWRLSRKVPSLMRRQIAGGRFPATVAAAVRDGAKDGGAAKWEQPVEDWVTNGLTQRDKLAAKVTARRRQIASQDTEAISPSTSPTGPPSVRQAPRQGARQMSADELANAKALAGRLLAATPPATIEDVAKQTGLSERTISRIKAAPAPSTVVSFDRTAREG